ncbi:MAG: RNA polymerase sigma factor [Bacteroidia bacterium]
MGEYKNIDERELAEGCKRNEKKHQELLYKTYSRKMLGVCWTYTKDNSLAKEVLQEGFIKVFKNIDSFRGEGSLEGWIRRIMVNTAINHYKKRMLRINHIAIEDIFYSAAEQSNEDVLSEITEKELLALVRELPDKCRMVLNLYALEGYSHDEIAETLNISVGTSKSQLSYARKKLSEKIIVANRVSYNYTHAITEDEQKFLQLIQG